MKEMTCIVCPNGCSLTVEEGETGIKVKGNLCRRGEQFAVTELTHPMRTVCTTVRTTLPGVPVLPVRVSKEIPKEKIFEVMEEINRTVLNRPVKRGSVLIPDVLGLGADVITTGSIPWETQTQQ